MLMPSEGSVGRPWHLDTEMMRIPIARNSVMCLDVVLGSNSSSQSDFLPPRVAVAFRKNVSSNQSHWLLLALGSL